MLVEAHDLLKKIIALEGNSVWVWYITNSAGPYVLARHKVDRIVSNPPWVSSANITVKERRKNLEGIASSKGLLTGDLVTSKLDIAQIFVTKCRELFLSNSKRDKAG